MDIVSHALAGASTGLYFNKPLLGAVIAISPDLVLGIRRKVSPPIAYNISHSLLFLTLVSLLTLTFGSDITLLVYFCLMSHLFLDIPTHGNQWAPPLLYPFSNERFHGCAGEWEFFNQSWLKGLVYTFGWILTWLLIIPIL